MPPIRARDLRVRIKEMGFEKGVVHTLEAMLAEHVEFRQQIMTIAEMADKCIDELGKLIQVGGKMHDTIEQLRRQQGDEHGDAS